MIVRAVLALLVAGVLVSAADASGQTVRYTLTPASRISQRCPSCESSGDPLSGTFDITQMPVSSDFSLDAMTQIDWQAPGISIFGSGFVQRLGQDEVAVVAQVRLNGAALLLTSGRRQHSPPHRIAITLTTPLGEEPAYTLRLVAVPTADGGTDPDGDGVSDPADNCPAFANAPQADSDDDGVGNDCDECEQTSFGEPIDERGCSVQQTCPCDGPAPDQGWKDQKEYVRCVVDRSRALERDGRLTRRQALDNLRRAVRSGCGRHEIAAR